LPGLAKIRPIERVLVVNRAAARVETFKTRLAQLGIPVEMVCAEEGCARADMIVTATPSKSPLFESAWVRPGTHISCMGADGVGKQELDPELLARSELFCDLPAQSVAIGEFQHVAPMISSGKLALTPIGRVLTGDAKGRSSEQSITVFDSSGISLQDLHIAQRILQACGGQ